MFPGVPLHDAILGTVVLATVLQELALPGTDVRHRDCAGGSSWLEMDFGQKTPAPPIRFSKVKRREAPTTHGLKHEGDNSNLKASYPVAQAFAFGT